MGEGESPGPLALVLLQDVPVLQLLQQGEDLVLVPVGEGQNGLQRHSVIEKGEQVHQLQLPGGEIEQAGFQCLDHGGAHLVQVLVVLSLIHI